MLSSSSSASIGPIPKIPSNAGSSFSPRPLSNTSPSSRPAEVSLEGVDILFLGAGNFSLPLNFILNHVSGSAAPNFPSRVLVTEHKSRRLCLSDPTSLNNYDTLSRLGTQFAFEIDATKIDRIFSKHRFTRIQFDCPDTGRHVFCSAERGLPRLIFKTAEAASRLQRPGDTLHFTLITPERPSARATWLGVHYEITEVENAGYYLNRGKGQLSGKIRYPMYTHKKTFGEDEVDAAKEEMAEYVFVRHPRQKTPERYISRKKGYKQLTISTGKTERVQGRKYPFYNRRPTSPFSPTIALPSFFKGNVFPKPNPQRFKPRLVPIRELKDHSDDPWMLESDSDISDAETDSKDFEQNVTPSTRLAEGFPESDSDFSDTETDSKDFEQNLTTTLRLAKELDDAMFDGNFDLKAKHTFRRLIRQECRRITS